MRAPQNPSTRLNAPYSWFSICEHVHHECRLHTAQLDLRKMYRKRASTQGLLRNAFLTGQATIRKQQRGEKKRSLKKELPVRCTGSSPPHFFWRRKSSGSPHQSQSPRTQYASNWTLVALFGPVERGSECLSLLMAGRFQPRVTSASMTYGFFQINEHCGFVTYFFPLIHTSSLCVCDDATRHTESNGHTPLSCTMTHTHNLSFWFLMEDQSATTRCSFVTSELFSVKIAARHFARAPKRQVQGRWLCGDPAAKSLQICDRQYNSGLRVSARRCP